MADIISSQFVGISTTGSLNPKTESSNSGDDILNRIRSKQLIAEAKPFQPKLQCPTFEPETKVIEVTRKQILNEQFPALPRIAPEKGDWARVAINPNPRLGPVRSLCRQDIEQICEPAIPRDLVALAREPVRLLVAGLDHYDGTTRGLGMSVAEKVLIEEIASNEIQAQALDEAVFREIQKINSGLLIVAGEQVLDYNSDTLYYAGTLPDFYTTEVKFAGSETDPIQITTSHEFRNHLKMAWQYLAYPDTIPKKVFVPKWENLHNRGTCQLGCDHNISETEKALRAWKAIHASIKFKVIAPDGQKFKVLINLFPSLINRVDHCRNSAELAKEMQRKPPAWHKAGVRFYRKSINPRFLNDPEAKGIIWHQRYFHAKWSCNGHQYPNTHKVYFRSLTADK
jgi:hypothetical protein